MFTPWVRRLLRPHEGPMRPLVTGSPVSGREVRDKTYVTEVGEGFDVTNF